MNRDIEAAKLDRSLRDFRTLTIVEARLAGLRQLVEYWHGPIEATDGFSDEDLEGVPAPFPLRWWYRLAGRRGGILSGQNRLLAPHELTVAGDGRLPFYVENQGVYLWSTLPDGDPPVWGKFENANEVWGDVEWTDEGMRLSEFLMEVCLFEAIMTAPYGAAAGWAEESTLARLRKELPLLPLTPWRWPQSPSQFYGREGAFMFACPNLSPQGTQAYSVWIGAKSPQPLAFLKGLGNEREWDHVAL